MLEHNVEVARHFAPLGNADMDGLRRDLRVSRQGLERMLDHHLDGPTNQPEIFWA